MRLLIATDGNERSDEAVRLGALMALQANGSLTICTVVRHDHEVNAANLVFGRAQSLIGSMVAPIYTRVRVGEPLGEILAEAQEGSYDLLVIGSLPSAGLMKRLRGHVSERIMANSPCPVLIAKRSAGPLNRSLVCSSGVEDVAGPVRFVAALAAIFAGKELTLLHVMSQISANPDVHEGWQLRAPAQQLIEEQTHEGRLLAARETTLQKAGFQVTAKIRHGLVVDEILAEAHSGGYDLVVIGAHNASGWQRFLLDDVAHQIVTQLDLPILVTPKLS